jgi:hypothetical protein
MQVAIAKTDRSKPCTATAYYVRTWADVEYQVVAEFSHAIKDKMFDSLIVCSSIDLVSTSIVRSVEIYY